MGFLKKPKVTLWHKDLSVLLLVWNADQEVLSSALDYKFNSDASKHLCPVGHSLLACSSDGCA